MRARYGPWALVAGASAGLGAAFARALAARGLDLVLVARREPKLRELAAELEAAHGIATRTLALDLAEPGAPGRALEACRDLEVGLLVCNAAYSPIGPFLARPVADALRAVELNAALPVALVHPLAALMAERGRGGIVLMSSLAAGQGSPYITAYGATKAFLAAFAEGLWYELRPRGVDVLAVLAGAVATPGLEEAAGKAPPGTLPPEAAVAAALAHLGRGPVVVPGRFNAFASGVMRRLLPRRTAIRIMAGQTAGLKGGE